MTGPGRAGVSGPDHDDAERRRGRVNHGSANHDGGNHEGDHHGDHGGDPDGDHRGADPDGADGLPTTVAAWRRVLADFSAGYLRTADSQELDRLTGTQRAAVW